MSTAREIAADYGNALRELTCNNKTQINMLTILAEDYKDVSPFIVEVIEKELEECLALRKILILYVIDSIVKNIPENGQYRLHFSKNIVKIFTHVFEESSEKTRLLLHKLRQTWTDIFPRGKLHDIDVRIHAIDKAWPVAPIAPLKSSSTVASSKSTTKVTTATTTALKTTVVEVPSRGNLNQPTVHVNPKFFGKNNTHHARDVSSSTSTSTSTAAPAAHISGSRRAMKHSPKVASKRRKVSPQPQIQPTKAPGAHAFVTLPQIANIKPPSPIISLSSGNVDIKPVTASLTPLSAVPPNATTATISNGQQLKPEQLLPPVSMGAGGVTEIMMVPTTSRSLPSASMLPSQSSIAPTPTDSAETQRQPINHFLPPQDNHINNDEFVPKIAKLEPPFLQQTLPTMGSGSTDMMPPITASVPSLSAIPPSTATISNETPRFRRFPTNNRVFIDGKAYEVIFLCDVPVIVRNGLPHRVSFSGPPRDIMIDGVLHKLAFGEVKTVIIDNEAHPIRFGAPSREFYMRDKPFRGVFGGPPIIVSIDGRRHEIRLLGAPPEAKIEQDPSYELARYMEPIANQQLVFGGAPRAMMSNGMPSMTGMTLPLSMAPRHEAPLNQNQISNVSNEVSSLLKRLNYSGLFGLSSQKKAPETPPPPVAPSLGDIRISNSPPIPSTQRLDNIERRAAPMSALDQFSMRSLVIRYDSVIAELLRDRVECPSCGISIKELYGEAYHQHTAWHMRVLKGDTYTRSRPWFMSEDWFTYSETDLANRATTAEGDKTTDDQTAGSSGVTLGDAFSGDIVENECCVCNEKFEEYYDEDDDAWKLRDSVIVDGKAFHRYCKTDATATMDAD